MNGRNNCYVYFQTARTLFWFCGAVLWNKIHYREVAHHLPNLWLLLLFIHEVGMAIFVLSSCVAP